MVLGYRLQGRRCPDHDGASLEPKWLRIDKESRQAQHDGLDRRSAPRNAYENTCAITTATQRTTIKTKTPQKGNLCRNPAYQRRKRCAKSFSQQQPNRTSTSCGHKWGVDRAIYVLLPPPAA